MNFSALSIRHPVPPILLFTLLTLLGLYSFSKLQIQHYPDIDLPVVTVTVGLDGAAPPQLETEVVRKIENAVATLEMVKHIRSSLSEGSANVTLEFDVDKNSDVAVNEVRNAVDSIRADLPQDLADPQITKMTVQGAPLVTFVVESDSLDEESLSWFVDNDVKRMVQAIPGVGGMNRMGGLDREVRVEVNPLRLWAMGVTVSEISQRLRQIQQDSSGGKAEMGVTLQGVRTLAAVNSVEDIKALKVSSSLGHHFRLDQLASVVDEPVERTAMAFLDDHRVVAFQVSRSRGASEVEVVERVRVAVSALDEKHPDVRFAEAYSGVDQVYDNYHGSMQLLYEGAFLAVVVVLWFLRDWRATMVSAAALPLSIIPTFAAIYLAGYTLNTVTLLALALVVGILVDDAIVEIENIVRHMRMGKTPWQASLEAADEIGLAVIATTATLIAVFLPTAFMSGMTGKFFGPFGWSAAISVFFSLLVARLITPMMAAYLLKPIHEPERESRLMARYLAMAAWCLRHRWTTLILTVILFALSAYSITLLPRGFIPAADRGRTTVNIDLQPGSTLTQTLRVAEQARAVVKQDPDVVSVFTSVGTAGVGGHFSAAKANVAAATLSVSLKYRTDRDRKQSAVESDLRERLRQIPGAKITVGAGESGEQLQVILASDDGDALDRVAAEAERQLRGLSGIGSVKSSANVTRPEIHITPDLERASRFGITSQAISDTVRVATAGDYPTYLPKLNLPERQIPIRVTLTPEFRHDIDVLKQVRIMGREGPVPLGSVATVEMGGGPSQISRLDRKRNLTFTIELNGRLTGEVLREVDALPIMKNLPKNVVRLDSGDVESMKDLFGSFGIAMVIGVACIYVVLVLLFHDFLQPITILTALPLSIGGTILALLATGNAFSMPSVIGILMLMGVVTKNSILLVEYALRARKESSLSRTEALLDACHKRARPILMTSIAMVAGMFPIALGWSAEPSFRSPMAIAVIGGLIASTFLCLVIIPVMFTFVDDIQRFFSVLIRRSRRA